MRPTPGLLASVSRTRDEDREPMRGGSLERDKPTSLLSRPWSAGASLFRHADEKAQEGRRGIGRVEAGRGKPLEG
jgi:hypothetical protein